MPQKISANPLEREESSSRLVHFPQGPAVSIIVTSIEGQLQQIHLESAPSYQCQYTQDLDPKVLQPLLDYFQRYGNKEKGEPFDLRLLEGIQALDSLTLFRKRVFRAMQRIPFGEVKPYGEVAARIGQPKAARAVGTACRCNPFQLLIPCHRVTAAEGKLGGYAAGLDLKKILLAFES